MMVIPGFSAPHASASSMVFLAIRSFTEPPALRYSHFTTKSSCLSQSQDRQGLTDFRLDAVALRHLLEADGVRATNGLRDGFHH